MFEKALIMYIYAETPMHPGSGAVVNSPVDLPIQRERYTEYPTIQGSSVKGVLKGCARNVGFTDDDIKRVFGPEKGDEGAGAIAVTDGRILAFPVRTLVGAFGWVTCPTVLNRYQRDLTNAGFDAKWETPQVNSDTSAIVSVNSETIIENSAYIEDFRLSADSSKNISNIIAAIQSAISDDDVYKPVREKLAKDLLIVHDTVFKDLVKLTTEVSARVKIIQKEEEVRRDKEGKITHGIGTVLPGALFYEEYLPTDTLMYALILCTKRVSGGDIDKLRRFNGQIIQIGGNETIGRGFAKIKVVTTDAQKP